MPKCIWCNKETGDKDAQLCNNCWELETRINQNLTVARQILENAEAALAIIKKSIYEKEENNETKDSKEMA